MFKIHVNVGRFAPGLADETFKQRLRAVRVNRGDAKAVTDRRIRRRPPSLTQNTAPPGKADNIKNRQEIGSKFQLCDQGQFTVEIGLNLCRNTIAVPITRPFPCLIFQLLHGVAPTWRNLVRIFIGQVRHAEFAQAGKISRRHQRIRPMPPAPRRLFRADQMPFCIAREQMACLVQQLFLADAGQHIGKRPPFSNMVKRITSRCQPQTSRLRHIPEKRNARLIRTITIKARPSEELTRHNLPELSKLGLIIQRRMHGRHHQQCHAGRQAGKISKMHDGGGLAAPQIGLAQQHGQRFIALTIKWMGNNVRPINQSQPRANNKTDVMITRGTMRPDNAGKRIDISNANRLPAKRRRRCHHFIRMRGTGQKGKIAVAAKHGRGRLAHTGSSHPVCPGHAKKPCKNQLISSPRSGSPSRYTQKRAPVSS